MKSGMQTPRGKCKIRQEFCQQTRRGKMQEGSIFVGQVLEPLYAMLDAFKARLKPNKSKEERLRDYPNPQLETKSPIRSKQSQRVKFKYNFKAILKLDMQVLDYNLPFIVIKSPNKTQHTNNTSYNLKTGKKQNL